MVELFWLLLPVAAISGWFAGRRDRGGGRRRPRELPSEYVVGLNYLLSEEQDKAVEVFTRLLEVNSDTVETHLALGNLFRRQGEVDRAIRIHQNLIARPSLSREQRSFALLELGHDYMKAGLLDRAENLFEQVIQTGLHVEAALYQLLAIYQQEKEWRSAIEVGRKLERRGERAVSPMVAQFYCELAAAAVAAREREEARKLLKQALWHDSACARASILQGDLARAQGDWRGALKAYLRVRQQDVDFLSEVLEPMSECYRALGDAEGMQRLLQDVLAEQPAVLPALELAEELRREQGGRAALEFLAVHLQSAPSVPGLAKLIELSRDSGESEQRRDLDLIVELFARLLRERPNYECRQCGFHSKSLYWQCPSCRCWATVKPIVSLPGE